MGAIIILSAISIFAVGSVIYFMIQDKKQTGVQQGNK